MNWIWIIFIIIVLTVWAGLARSGQKEKDNLYTEDEVEKWKSKFEDKY